MPREAQCGDDLQGGRHFGYTFVLIHLDYASFLSIFR